MRITVAISDALLKAAREQADRDGLTLRALIEEGLRRVLREGSSTKPFVVRRASFRGHGLQPFVREGSWETIREHVYERRGS